MNALSFYRLLPRRLRRRLFQLIPESRQLWLVRRLVPLPDGPRQIDRDGQRMVRDRGQWLPARVRETATPFEARRDNLDAVVATFDEIGLEYFRIRPVGELKTALAVRLDHQLEVAAHLRATLNGYTVRWVSTRSRLTNLNGGHKALLQVFRPIAAERGGFFFGTRYACEIEFWREEDDQLIAPRRNAVSGTMSTKFDAVTAEEQAFGRFTAHASATRRYRTRSEFALPAVDIPSFPIDAVYTWVDGSDPDWQARKSTALAAHGVGELSDLAANSSRYVSRDELRFALRSAVYFAPWIRHIYLVTDDQVPHWLDVGHPMITLVRHRDIFGSTGRLPTFNSHAIESRLHRIPGLAEHFLYVNDDMFFGRPVLPTTFFHANGVAKFFTSLAQLEAGPSSIDDAPVTAAGKNNRHIIEERYGRTVTQKMKHIPYPLRRSILEEIDNTLTDQARATAAHQFRHPADLSIPSSLHHYWSFLSGQSVPGSIRYTYADLAHPSTPVRLRNLLTNRNVDVFCLNDTDSAEIAHAEQMAMLAEFLPAYFPFRGPFELPDEAVAERSRLSATALAMALETRPITVPSP